MDIVSLFSGAGGLDLGLIRAGHRIIWANDHDTDAVATYEKNIGPHITPDDIADVDSATIPDGDVIVGGFPCQGFSQANLRRSGEDERNTLYVHFRRIVKDKQPLYFLAENVRGILSLDGGNAIRTIVSDFSDAGYRVQYKCFNVADFGVPQTRWRVIIAGTRKDLPTELDYCYPEPTHQKNGTHSDDSRLSVAASGLQPWVSIEDALRGIPDPEDDTQGLCNHVYSKYKVTNRNFTGHRMTDPKKPSPTILARGDGKGGVCAIQHPLNHRRMSIRECATIQTFPLSFEFVGRMNSCYRQVGNAVPVLFAEKLGLQLKLLEDRLDEWK